MVRCSFISGQRAFTGNFSGVELSLLILGSQPDMNWHVPYRALTVARSTA